MSLNEKGAVGAAPHKSQSSHHRKRLYQIGLEAQVFLMLVGPTLLSIFLVAILSGWRP